MMKSIFSLLVILLLDSAGQFVAASDEPIRIWPDFAPGETTKETGTLQPFRKNEKPPVSRVIKITLPTMTFYPASKPNGSAVVILPGGGFTKVVPDKEGSELAAILNKSGVSSFVLSYRTKNKPDENGWSKSLQDAQRAIAYVRANAQKWNLKKDRIGIVGFSAGGHVAARLLASRNVKSYRPLDEIDDVTHRPDFAMLIYPWNLYDPKTKSLVDGLKIPQTCPPTFLVHTDDDRSSSMGTVLLYAGLKRHKIPAALHVYARGGHGYGTRAVSGTQIGEWPKQAQAWLKALKF